ncbi:MAG: transcription termination/antitermination protein NusG [Acidobacteriaceae bacterium]|nr:transcription termination/antitermination protein NusG [Acidobacteriaceae bacterium]
MVLHSVSDRGLMRPLVGASDSHPKVVKRAWFAVYTISRHEKFVQAQLTAKQIQSFLPLYKVERRWRNGVRREIQYPLFPGYVFVCLGPVKRFRCFKHRVWSISWETVEHRYRSTIKRCVLSA